jgi:butyryl-CoA dehydrogenase
MMSFELTQEQEMLRKSIREFAEGEIKPRAIEMDEKERFDTSLVRKMGEMGL